MSPLVVDTLDINFAIFTTTLARIMFYKLVVDRSQMAHALEESDV